MEINNIFLFRQRIYFDYAKHKLTDSRESKAIEVEKKNEKRRTHLRDVSALQIYDV